MIINYDKVINTIVAWIKEYISNTTIKSLVINTSECTIESLLTVLLCKKTGIKTIMIGIDNLFPEERFQQNFATEHSVEWICDPEKYIYDDVRMSFHIDPYFIWNKKSYTALKNSVHFSLVNYYCTYNNGVIVGSDNKNKMGLIRNYNKFGIDIAPLADLYKSECNELFFYLSKKSTDFEKNGLNVLVNGLSHSEIEWADREEIRTQIAFGPALIGATIPVGIVTSELDPSKHIAWMGYSGRQREVVAQMHQLEKASRHKYNPNLPICELRSKLDLVR